MRLRYLLTKTSSIRHLSLKILKMEEESPIFSFGVISDIQYADIDDRMNFGKTCWRHYRESLNVLKKAIKQWKEEYDVNNVAFVLQLGDALDGFNSQNNESKKSLTTLMTEFNKFPGTVHHTWGNHELYNFMRAELMETDFNSSPYKNIQPVGNMTAYYDFYPNERFCFIVLDTYEIGVIGYEEGHPIREECEEFLSKWNPNEVKMSSNGMEGKDRRIVSYNAAVGDEQLKWLDKVLRQAQRDRRYVIISGHQPIYEPASCYTTVCWNYDKILDILHKYTCVVAYFAGHDHDGGYAVDERGIHHFTMHGVIESEEGDGDFATMYVYEDRMILKGHGRVQNRVVKLPVL